MQKLVCYASVSTAWGSNGCAKRELFAYLVTQFRWGLPSCPKALFPLLHYFCPCRQKLQRGPSHSTLFRWLGREVILTTCSVQTKKLSFRIMTVKAGLGLFCGCSTSFLEAQKTDEKAEKLNNVKFFVYSQSPAWFMFHWNMLCWNCPRLLRSRTSGTWPLGLEVRNG